MRICSGRCLANLGMWLALGCLRIVRRGTRRVMGTWNSRNSRGRKRRLRVLLGGILGAALFGWIIPSLETMMVEAVGAVVDAAAVEDLAIVVDAAVVAEEAVAAL